MPKAISAMMQPTYLPWIGYFDLIDQSDSFVLLDDLQFSKQSWQQRNRIRMATKADWLSVPVEQKMGQTLQETKISQTHDFSVKHLKSIELNYSRAKFFSEYYPSFQKAFHEAAATGLLTALNISMIRWIAEQLSIQTPMILSSELKIVGQRSIKLVNLCKQLQSTLYLSTVGAEEYLQEDKLIFSDAGIEIFLHQYQHPEWKQVYEPFIPFCSAIDLIFNHGPDSRAIMLTGRREMQKL